MGFFVSIVQEVNKSNLDKPSYNELKFTLRGEDNESTYF